jgi:hypothetical protein
LPVLLAPDMDNLSPTPSAAAVNPPLPNLERLAHALSHVTRWKMLRELSLGEPCGIVELARATGCSYDSAIKHCGVLLKAGLVARGRGKVFQIQKHHLISSSERTVDFGHCLLRLEAKG